MLPSTSINPQKLQKLPLINNYYFLTIFYNNGAVDFFCSEYRVDPFYNPR